MAEADAPSAKLPAATEAVMCAHAALDAALNELTQREHGLDQREKNIKELERACNEERQKLLDDRARFEHEASLVADHNAATRDIVELSIGGEHFVTVPRKTLTQFEGSMLAAMFSGRHHLMTDPRGKVLLDRDPKHFHYVLDYLCNGGKLPANLPTDEAELQRIKDEFDYFLLGNAFQPKPRNLPQALAQRAYDVITLESAVSGLGYNLFATVSDRYVCIAHNDDVTGIEVWNLDTGSHHIARDAPREHKLYRSYPSIHQDLLAITVNDDRIEVLKLGRAFASYGN